MILSSKRKAPDFKSVEDEILIDGFLTPRMHCRVLECAKTSAALCKKSLRELSKKRLLENPDVFLMNHVPYNLRRNIFKSFAIGFHQCLEAIAMAMSLQSGRAPTPLLVYGVLNEEGIFNKKKNFDGKRHYGYYIENGGRIEHAIAAVLLKSQKEYEFELLKLGDGSFKLNTDLKTKIESLPSHTKDNDFDFLRAKLIGTHFRSQPYADGEGEEKEFDSKNWQDWPLVKEFAWGFVYIETINQFGYYEDEGVDSERECALNSESEDYSEEEDDDPLCLVYLGAPLASAYVNVPLSSLRKPPFKGHWRLNKYDTWVLTSDLPKKVLGGSVDCRNDCDTEDDNDDSSHDSDDYIEAAEKEGMENGSKAQFDISQFSSDGWESWPPTKHCDWGLAFSMSRKSFGYYWDDDTTNQSDPMCTVYNDLPSLCTPSFTVRLSDLRKPPFDDPSSPIKMFSEKFLASKKQK